MVKAKNKKIKSNKKWLIGLIFFIFLTFFYSCKNVSDESKIFSNNTGFFVNVLTNNFKLCFYIDNSDVKDYKKFKRLTNIRSFSILVFDYKNLSLCDGKYYYLYYQGTHFICNIDKRCKKLYNPLIDFDFLINELIKFKINNRSIDTYKQFFYSQFNMPIIDINFYYFDLMPYLKILQENNPCFDIVLKHLVNLIENSIVIQTY